MRDDVPHIGLSALRCLLALLGVMCILPESDARAGILQLSGFLEIDAMGEFRVHPGLAASESLPEQPQSSQLPEPDEPQFDLPVCVPSGAMAPVTSISMTSVDFVACDARTTQLPPAVRQWWRRVKESVLPLHLSLGIFRPPRSAV